MKKCIKRALCLLLVVSCMLGLTGCAGNNKLTEENVTATVQSTQKALQSFDMEALNKYVDSKTLSYILTFAEKKEQFVSLGKAMFESLSMEVQSVDLENKTVTVLINNKDLMLPATDFAHNLKNNYSTLQLLGKLEDDAFLNENLGTLTQEIGAAEMKEEPTEIVLHIEQGKKNLVLSFDETAEDAVSGGALTAIKEVFSL